MVQVAPNRPRRARRNARIPAAARARFALERQRCRTARGRPGCARHPACGKELAPELLHFHLPESWKFHVPLTGAVRGGRDQRRGGARHEAGEEAGGEGTGGRTTPGPQRQPRISHHGDIVAERPQFADAPGRPGLLHTLPPANPCDVKVHSCAAIPCLFPIGNAPRPLGGAHPQSWRSYLGSAAVYPAFR